MYISPKLQQQSFMKKVFLLWAFGFSISLSSAQSEAEKVSSTISQDEIKGHIYFLADDLLQGRATGTPGNKIAASYLANTLRGYGVKPNPKTGTFYQDVILSKTKPPKISLSVDGKPLSQIVALSKADEEYSGEMVFLNHGLKEDYSGKNVKGKIILVKAGSPTASDPQSAYRMMQEKRKLAEEAGAVAVIEVIKVNDRTWGFIEHEFQTESLEIAKDEKNTDENAFPYVWLKEAELDSKYLNNSGNSKIEFKIKEEPAETVVSQNVVGIIEGTDPKLKNEYVMYSAHYDHVGIGAPDATGDTIYNGARDNAVGTTTVLSMADNLSKYPTKRSALFVLFTGEEKGLLGSQYYVANPIIPLEQVVYGFNSDNAGYNDTSVATIIGLERTTAAPNIKKAATTFGITAIDDPAPEQGLFDRSDNVAFAAKGIPAPTFSLGFQSFDGDVTKYYHQAGDEADTLDYDYLLKFFRAYVLAGRLIANDPVTPFWTPGDKYEKAGKELYKMQ